MNNRPNMKHIVPALAFLLICAFGFWLYPRFSGTGPVKLSKPFIILMSFDALRADHLSCYGYARETSPNVDRFADDSVVFENALTQGAKTASAHMSIFTSVLPIVHGVSNRPRDGEFKVLPDRFATLPEVLHEHGYLTAGFVGGGNVDGSLGFARGFDHYSNEIEWNSLHKNPKSLKSVSTWIRRSKRQKKPLFLFLHHYICHEPYIKGPGNLRLQFMEEKVEGLPVDPKELGPGTDYYSRNAKFWSSIDLGIPEHKEHVLALYDGGISYADTIFQMILDILHKEKIYEDSLIVFLSDHGEEFYEHSGKSHGQLFIESIHVPLMMKFPGGRHAGRRIGAIVRTMDVMPSLLEAAGIEPVQTMDGVSFLPVLTGERSYNPPIISYSDDSRFFRFQKEELIFIEGSEPSGEAWLIDRAIDPGEQNNLAEKQPEVLERIRAEAWESIPE